MKRVHLLGVSGPSRDFAPLAAELSGRGERLGWLDWNPGGELPGPPPELAEAADLPALRAVAVAAGGHVVVKRTHGPPVLRDVVREHFRGCLVVLVRGEIEAARLAVSAGGFEVQQGDRRWSLDAAALADRLRRPDPWGG